MPTRYLLPPFHIHTHIIMKTRLLSLFLAALAVVFTFSACGGGGGNGSNQLDTDTEHGIITTYDFVSGRKYFVIYANSSVLKIWTRLGGDNEYQGADYGQADANGRHVHAYASVNDGDAQSVLVYYRKNEDNTAMMNITNELGGEIVPDPNAEPILRVLAGGIAGTGDQVSIGVMTFDFRHLQVGYTVTTYNGTTGTRNDYATRQFMVARQQ